jgi:hypothetical protein
MQFVLTGFTQDIGFRVFAFEGIGTDRARISFTVRTDLALIQKYGIHIQDLPLLCRGLLEHRAEGEQGRAMTFTEDGMRAHAANCAAEREAAKNKKSRYKPPPAPAGASWRIPQR